MNTAAAITAKLGLDTKDFQKDLQGVAGRLQSITGRTTAATQQAANASRAATGAAKAGVDTLGLSLGQLGKQWMGAAVGTLISAVAITSIWNAVKASNELGKSLSTALQPTNPDFTSLDEMQRRLEGLSKTVEAGSAHFKSVWGQVFDDTVSGLETIGTVIANPIDAWNGKVSPVDRNAQKQKDLIARRKEQLDLEQKIAAKQGSQNANAQIAFTVSAAAAGRNEAERRLKEAQGAAAKASPEARDQLKANAQGQYELEIAQINKKYELQEEEYQLAMKIADLSGSAAEDNIRSLEMEVKMLERRLVVQKEIMNAEEKEALALQIKQKSNSLTDAKANELRKTPQQREAEKREVKAQEAARRAVEAREASRKVDASLNSTEENRDSAWRERFGEAGGKRLGPRDIRPELENPFRSKKEPIAEQVKKGVQGLRGGGGSVDTIGIIAKINETNTKLDNIEKVLNAKLGAAK